MLRGEVCVSDMAVVDTSSDSGAGSFRSHRSGSSLIYRQLGIVGRSKILGKFPQGCLSRTIYAVSISIRDATRQNFRFSTYLHVIRKATSQTARKICDELQSWNQPAKSCIAPSLFGDSTRLVTVSAGLDLSRVAALGPFFRNDAGITFLLRPALASTPRLAPCVHVSHPSFILFFVTLRTPN